MSDRPCECGGDARCGCCEGTEAVTPLATANRPGLLALRYRVGTHATFFETMLARLSGHRLADGRRPLKQLTTRVPDDPAIALLDAWATVADVLTFYQERIANEGYLLTATERRSVLELARLVGYRLRPGVAASVYLAFRLEDDFDVEIPAGTRALSLPGPGELPQAFETDEPLRARTEWNALAPRLTRPSALSADLTFEGSRKLWLEGTTANLQPNDTLLLFCGAIRVPYAVRAVEPDAARGRTRVTYAPFVPPPETSSTEPAPSTGNGAAAAGSSLSRLGAVVQALRKEPSLPPASRFQLARAPERTYSAAADLGPQLIVHFDPRLADTLYTAYANAPVTGPEPSEPCRVEALRVKAAVYGHNAPPPEDGPIIEIASVEGSGTEAAVEPDASRVLPLDTVYDGIVPGSWAVVDPGGGPDDVIVTQVDRVRTRSRADLGIAVRVTELVLRDAWFDAQETDEELLELARRTTVHVLNESLELAEEPIEEPVAEDVVELDGVYDGLAAGRWLLIHGERTDVLDANGQIIDGIEASELVMLAGIAHETGSSREAEEGDGEEGGEPEGDEEEDGDENGGPAPPPDTLHTRLLLAESLAYAYKRDTVTINANVVRATHGETREEVIGSGDAARAFQAFTLSQSPLTFVSAPTAKGVESTLLVRVNDVRWPEKDALLELDSSDRGYVTRTDDEGNTTVVFGDGRRGVRLPTGAENVMATYRKGIGKARERRRRPDQPAGHAPPRREGGREPPARLGRRGPGDA